MSVADWAIFISLGSLVISLLGFVWSVWSTYIFPKPKVQIHSAVMTAYSGEFRHGSAISISATNFGPNEVILHSAIGAEKKGLLQNKPEGIAIFNPYNSYPNDLNTSGPFSGGLPKKLGVGEQFSVYLPMERRYFEEYNLTSLGFQDTFGRYHWAPRKSVRNVSEQVLQEADNVN